MQKIDIYMYITSCRDNDCQSPFLAGGRLNRVFTYYESWKVNPESTLAYNRDTDKPLAIATDTSQLTPIDHRAGIILQKGEIRYFEGSDEIDPWTGDDWKLKNHVFFFNGIKYTWTAGGAPTTTVPPVWWNKHDKNEGIGYRNHAIFFRCCQEGESFSSIFSPQ